MYRAQMTDSELEVFYMEGEFKPTFNIPPLHPKHMTDTELKNELKKTTNLKSDYSKALVKEATLRFGDTNGL